MENKSKLATIGERLISGGAQMGRMVSLKVKEMKDLLQSPTPESRLVDQATLPSLESPDWGLNLRICSLINGNELNGGEIVKAIKRKVCSGGSGDNNSQSLAIELLEACAMNCDKIFSEIASEKLVEDLVVKVIENPDVDQECRVRVMELIRVWGENPDLSYLPIYRQTYEDLKKRSMSSQVEGTFPPMEYSLGSYLEESPVPPPENYPLSGVEPNGSSGASMAYNYGSLSTEQKKEFLEITRNSLEVLSSLLNSGTEPNVTEDDLTMSMVDKCKESQPVVQRIVQSTTDDEGLLFEALNLNDELQKVITKFDDMQMSVKSEMQQPDEPNETRSSAATTTTPSIASAETADSNKSTESFKEELTKHDASDLLSGDGESSHDKQ